MRLGGEMAVRRRPPGRLRRLILPTRDRPMDVLPDFILAHAFWSWMALGAIFLAVEVATGSGWLLWPAGSAALTGLAVGLWPMNPPVAVAPFGVLTIATTYCRPRVLPRAAPAVHRLN